jgi:general stress protein 26
MNKEEAIDIVRDAGFGFLATVEGNQPRVRPMMPYLTEEGELLLALLGRSRTIPEIKANANVDVCYVDRPMWKCVMSTGKCGIAASPGRQRSAAIWTRKISSLKMSPCCVNILQARKILTIIWRSLQLKRLKP